MIEELHVETVAGLAQDEPVVMLNLMKFHDASLDGDGSGWDAYVRYSQMSNKLIRERDGRIFWAGEVTGVPFGPVDQGQWDYGALVWYPSPAAFLDMMDSDDYAAANVHRTNGCESHLIMAVNETYSRKSPNA